MTITQELLQVYAIPAVLALAMLGMGAKLRLVDFAPRSVGHRPLALGVLLQALLPPLFAVLVVALFRLPPAWAVGLALVSVAPAGGMANVYAHLGRGDTALSIALTLAGTVLAVVTVPLGLAVLAGPHLAADFEMPVAAMFADAGLYMLGPLALGMVLRRAVGEGAAAVLARWSLRSSMLGLGGVAVVSLLTGQLRMSTAELIPAAGVIFYAGAMTISGAMVLLALGRSDREVSTVSCGLAVRNAGLALVLVHFFFVGQPAQQVVLTCCLFYAGVSMVIGALMVLFRRYLLAFGRWLIAQCRGRSRSQALPLPLSGEQT